MPINLSLASALVRIIMAGAISGGGGGALSINLNWGQTDCFNNGGTCTVTSPTRTFSGSGQIRLDKTGSATTYSLNGGAFTAFSTGQLLTIANADTLAFKSTVLGGVTINVVSTATSASIGTFDMQNAAGGEAEGGSTGSDP